jgi:excisionase family DNA binding protein
MTRVDGHNSGTLTPPTSETLVPQGLPGAGRRPSDCESGVFFGWPRLLTIEQAARYLGISRDTLLGYVRDGSLAVTRPLRAQTARARGYRNGKSRRTVLNAGTLRRMLFDRHDLDALVDCWKRGGGASQSAEEEESRR